VLYTEYQKVDHKTSGCPFRFTKGILYVWGLKMAIKNFSEIKQLIDIGMEKGYLTPDEINDFLPQNIFSPEEIEDIFDFLSESNIDIVETIKEKVEHNMGISKGYRPRIPAYIRRRIHHSKKD